jgi:4'-phosphopantetheinyl transferase
MLCRYIVRGGPARCDCKLYAGGFPGDLRVIGQSTEWEPPPENYALPVDEVHVWRASPDQPDAYIRDLKQILSPDEQERAAKFYFEADRRRYVVGRSTLRMLVGHCLGTPADRLRFDFGEAGKPSVTAGVLPPLQFNVSHSREVVLIALARGRALGIDVEQIRTSVAVDQIAARFFSANEYKGLSLLTADMQRDAFFACWTRKEAYLKASGAGLSLPLDQFEVSLLPGDQPRLIATRHDPAEATRWTLRELDVGHGYKAAMAVEGSDWTLKCWDWPAHEWTVGSSDGIGWPRRPRFLSAT